MFERVEKIKDFGIYKDFTWSIESIEDFKRYNLVYGANGSGKTTFSRIFSSIENEKILDDFNDGYFKCKLKNGSVIKSNDLGDKNILIKVFNRDFIEENIFFHMNEKHLNPLVYISKVSIDKQKKIEKLSKEIEVLTQEGVKLKKDTNIKEGEYNDCLTKQGQYIKNNLGKGYITYNKRSIEEKIKYGLDRFKILSLNEYGLLYETIQIVDKTSIPPLKLIDFTALFKVNFLDFFNSIKSICESKITAQIIEELKDDSTFHKWVQDGLEIHQNKKSKDKCLFCKNDITDNLFEKYGEHFNKELEGLIKAINVYTDILSSVKKRIISPIAIDSSLLFPDLQEIFIKEKNKFNKFIDTFNDFINNILDALEKKKVSPYDEINIDFKYYDFINELNNHIVNINNILISNNKKVNSLATEIKTAKEKIVNHLIKKCFEDNGLEAKIKIITKANKEIDIKQRLYRGMVGELKELNEQSTDIGGAIITINEYLKDFFSREDIFLELGEDENGYIIKRNNRIAKHLSEGEKTAIAFSFFLASINEKGLDSTKGIYFIDDPISSFDSSFIFHVFSLIKNTFENVEQLFISTHNFEFFSLIRDWLYNKKEVSYYQISNLMDGTERVGYITDLSKTIKDFKTEYHFLFFTLTEFLGEEEDDFKDYYLIGNVARRFMEVYLHFKIPMNGDMKSKLDKLLSDISYSDIKKEKLYKLVNEYSHFSRVEQALMHNGKTEIKDGINILLEIIKKADERHFECLVRETGAILV